MGGPDRRSRRLFALGSLLALLLGPRLPAQDRPRPGADAGQGYAQAASPAGTAGEARVGGSRRVWEPLTLEVHGPESGEAAEPNPFLDRRVTATFTCGKAQFEVPGYFAADGKAVESGATAGDVWRVHFVPDRPGRWRYRVSVRGGPKVALDDDPDAGEPSRGDGLGGTIEVAPNPGAPGMLRYVGGRYLRYAQSDADYLKSGADSPENLLAYADFDGTEPGRGRAAPRREGEARQTGLHTYGPHVRDWKPGDPTWRDGKGKGLIGALNYLASKGINSVYFLTLNIEGDGRDVWPYTMPQERLRFDCSKLDQWEVAFAHMDRLGIMLHVVLTETENEGLFEVEGGGAFADARKLYYRELVARFAHHRAVEWNLGEENGWDDRDKPTSGPAAAANTHTQRKAFANYLRRLDHYDHPIVVHTLPGRYEEIYAPLLGHPAIEGPSLQIADAKRVHAETIRWLDRSERAGRPWFVCLDELGPADTGVRPDADDPDHDEVRRYALWGNLMAGGSGCEWYFGYKYPHNDLDAEDFRSRARMWDQTRHAVEFFRRHLPFAAMRHADDAVTNPEAYCLAKPGEVYAAYLPTGGTTELELPDGDYSVWWYNPRDGGELQKGTVTSLGGGGPRSLGAAPHDGGKDWVVVVRRGP